MRLNNKSATFEKFVVPLMIRHLSFREARGRCTGFQFSASRISLQPNGCIKKREAGFAKEGARSAAQAWRVLDA